MRTVVTLDDSGFHLQSPDSPCRACVRIEATSLRDALAAAEKHFHVTFQPHDEQKWFRVHYPPQHPYHEMYARRSAHFPDLYDTGDSKQQYRLVDIHIRRNEEWLCPKQDLEFPLLPRDTVHFMQLIC